MDFESRKLRVGLISLGVVLVVYLLYGWLSKTPPIDTQTQFTDTVADSNISGYASKGGGIGGVDVPYVQKARFIDLDKETKEVIREWGFEELLHDTGKEWEIEKPYMNIFRRTFKCYITSDKGRVQVETVAGKVKPKGVKLTENVVFHILPEDDGGINESFIYLDDVDFVSDKSQFSTTGLVKFVSQDIQMLGRGLELVYNEGLERLEFLRISHLESVHAKVPLETRLFSPSQTDFEGPADTNSRPEIQQPNEPAVAAGSQKTKPLPAASTQVVEQTEDKNYRCVLSKNVVIKSPYDLVFADDEVSINNIFRPDISGKRRDVPSKKEGEPNELEQELIDIVVTCDGGIIVTPMDSPTIFKSSAKPAAEATNTDNPALSKALEDANDRTTFLARKIDYNASTGDTVALGPTELTFYTTDPTHTEAENKTIPVKVTARKKAEFFPALRQAVFEGDSQCTVRREGGGLQQTYTLYGQKLKVNISEDKDKRTSDWTLGIDHLSATGGVVRLVTLKTTGEKLLGGVEIKCVQFDYDTIEQLFLATGPGTIALDNSRASEPNEVMGRFSLRGPCWAIVKNFDTLKYFLEENRIVADAGSQTMIINYVPVVNGQYGQDSVVNANHIEALLYQTPDDQTELSMLTASGGITYEDDDNQFVGSELFYDHHEFLIKVKGDELQPCYFNGALVDGIEYNVRTAEGTVNVIVPGALQVKSKN